MPVGPAARARGGTGQRLRVVLALASACWAAPVWAQDLPSQLELRVKAAYIYKFANYVEWPASAHSEPSAPFVIGVIGDDEYLPVLEQVVHGRTVGGRRIVVQAFRSPLTADQPQILFVAGVEPRRLERMLTAAPTAPCLVITDTPGALAWGSVINFTTDDGHVRFEISKVTADARGLRLSSRLLDVAQTVVARTP